MTSLIKTALHTNTSYSIKQNLSSESFYMFIGRTSPWVNDLIPPDIQDTDSENLSILSEIYAIKKITSNNACLVVPRYNWSSGTVYDQYSASDDSLYTKHFYVITSDMNVYKCISNNTGASSTVQPIGQSTSAIQTGDGYIWKFMYNLSTSISSLFLTDAYLPIPTGDQKTSSHIAVEAAAAYTVGSPPRGHGSNASVEMGATRIMIYQTFSSTESGIIDASSEYRRVGVLKNPKLISSGSTATGSVYSVGDSSSDIDTTTGEILYVENRSPVQRNIDQSENIKIVINFD